MCRECTQRPPFEQRWPSGFSPLRPPSGERRLYAARTGVSECAGFTPNHKTKAVCHSARFHSRPTTLLRAPFCPLPRPALLFTAAAQVKKKTLATSLADSIPSALTILQSVTLLSVPLSPTPTILVCVLAPCPPSPHQRKSSSWYECQRDARPLLHTHRRAHGIKSCAVYMP